MNDAETTVDVKEALHTVYLVILINISINYGISNKELNERKRE